MIESFFQRHVKNFTNLLIKTLIKAGDKLIIFDREKIAAAKHPDCVVVLVTNADDYENLAIQAGPCKVLDSVITV